MIAVLRRQLIDKRTPRAIRIRTAGPRLFKAQPEYKFGTEQRVVGRKKRGKARPPFLERQKPARTAHLRREKSPHESDKADARGPIRLVLRWASNPLFTIILSVLLLLTIALPVFLLKTGDIVKPPFPSTSDAAEELNRIFVPERPQDTGTGALSAAALKSLRVSSYTVRRGDSLSQIAQNQRLDIGTIISFNGIKDGRSLSPGAVLRIPNSDGMSYRVRRGDTLEKIAKSFSVPLESVLDFNSLTSSVIAVGQELFIPGARMSTGDINKILGYLFVWPVSGARISSRFGDRNDPFTGVVRAHNGIDLVQKTDTPIGAAMAGEVSLAGFNANYGNYVIIKHTGTVYQTLYGHLDKILVSRGEKVKQGQTIGLLGTTGYSTGPHLHFSVFKNGVAIDPLQYLK